MEQLFKALTDLIRDAEKIMNTGPEANRAEMAGIIEELVYMRNRLGSAK
jgi:hypothetical protein